MTQPLPPETYGEPATALDYRNADTTLAATGYDLGAGAECQLGNGRNAPAGTTNWGPNQCKNDRDGTVDSDERLRITDTPPGIYDAKLVDTNKRTCVVRNLKLDPGEIFSIEEKELTSSTE